MTGLRCDQLVEQATAYLEASLAAAEGRRFAAHLAGCAGCRCHLDQLRRTVRSLAGLPADPLPPSLPEAVLAAYRRPGRTGRPHGSTGA